MLDTDAGVFTKSTILDITSSIQENKFKNMADQGIQDLIDKLNQFASERQWGKFHTPKNLVMALASESGELSEIFQWLTNEESLVQNLSEEQLNKIREETADIFLYLLILVDKLNIDIIQAANDKITLNAKKYPVELSKGNAKKYTEL